MEKLEKTWDEMASRDPLWAVLTWPEKYGGKWNVDEFFANGRVEASEVERHIKSSHPKVPRRRALDFGCGVGRVTQGLSAYFEEVVGVDISPRMIELAKRHDGSSKCAFIANPRPDLSAFPDGTFDLVYSNITLQHMDRHLIELYMKEFLRVVSSDGVVVFQLLSHRAPTLKAQVLRFLPYSLHRKLSHPGWPIVPMNAIRRERLLELFGDRVLHIERDLGGGPNWVSYRYCVLK
ncbi:MAG: class I SAM-dependent methyltransferase [Thaumarchaeota archaeon]|nr:class I SAM-dependent methyltransferase [Nitrososphaerota archaeon]